MRSRICRRSRSGVLMGVLESGTFSRLKSAAVQRFDARVLSSAQPGIEGRAGTVGSEFRRDLLGHLNTLIVRIPPLRDYAEDVPELLRHYVDRAVDAEGLPFRRFSVAAQNRMRNYPWPDNLRELKNLVQRLLIQGGPEEIRLEEIEHELAMQTVPGRAAGQAGPAGAAAARSARAVRARLPAAAAAAVQRQGGAAGQAGRHGAHPSVSQAALAGRGLPRHRGRLSCAAPARSVADADHQRIDIRRLQLAAHLVQLGQIADRPDAHAKPDVGIQRDALHLGVDALQRQLAGHPIGIGLVAVRTGLQHVGAGLFDLRRGQVALHVAFLLRHHHFEFRQHRIEVVVLRAGAVSLGLRIRRRLVGFRLGRIQRTGRVLP